MTLSCLVGTLVPIIGLGQQYALGVLPFRMMLVPYKLTALQTYDHKSVQPSAHTERFDMHMRFTTSGAPCRILALSAAN